MSNRIKVVEFIPRLVDGGAETLVKDYVQLIDKNRFQLAVMTLWSGVDSANEKSIRESGVVFYSIYGKTSKLKRAFHKAFGEIYVPFKMKKMFKNFNPNVMHIHLALINYTKLCGDVLNKIKLVYTCHSLPSLLLDNKRKKEGDAVRYLLNSSGIQLIALHDDMKKDIDKMFNINSTCVIHNAINLERFMSVQETKTSIRNSLGIRENAFVLGHVGRFSAQKNHRKIINIFNTILKEEKEAHLLLVGDGETKSEIGSLAQELNIYESITFLEKRNDIPRLMKAMDAFVFPSLFEGLGIVVIEAQAAGLKCVVSDKVPSEAFVSSNIITLSNNDDDSVWAEQILRGHGLQRKNRLIDYDMKNEIKKLENLYMME